jgi:SAM-dependent methyltransferase
MDDENFDPHSAALWIQGIEGSGNGVRAGDGDIFPQLRDWIHRRRAVTVLDIGCGQGICSTPLDLTGRRYTGVDPSPLLVARARERYSGPDREFREGNAYRLPFADGSFDAAFSVSVWHLLRDLPLAAREMSRVLRPGGGFLIVTAHPDAYQAWCARYTDAQREGDRFTGTLILDGKPAGKDVLYLRPLTAIREALAAAGLALVVTRAFRAAPDGGPPLYLTLEGEKK